MDSGKHRVGGCTVGKTAARAGRAPPDSAECRLSRLLFRHLPADRGEYADCRPAPAPGSGAAVRHSGGQSAGREPRTRRSAPADPPGGGQCGTGRRDPGQYVLAGKMVRQFRFRRALRDADAKGGGRGSYADRLAGNGTDCHDRPLRRCPRPAEPARTRNRRNPAGRRLYLRDGHRKQPAVQFRRRFPAGRKYVRNSVQQAEARPLRGIRPLPGAGHAAGAAAGRHRDAGKRSAGRRPLRGVRPRSRAGRVPDLL